MTSIDAMEPRLLRSFVAVAEELHFGRAAKRLHMTQPPLSMQIKKLEALVGATLFERDRRHVVLTEAGAFLLDRARHLLNEAERSFQAVGRIARGEAGILVVGYTATATYEILPPLLRAHRTRRPDVRLELVEMRSPLLPDAIRARRVDIGFACGPVDADGIVSRVLTRERFVAAVPHDHPLAGKSHVRLCDLQPHPFVQVRPDIEPAWASACTAALLRARFRPEITQETDTKIALLGLVAAGMGVSIVSESMTRLGRDGVAFRPIDDLDVRVPLVVLSSLRSSFRVDEFLRLAGRRGRDRSAARSRAIADA
ncbi:MAG TPA: LysR substrate-binding domain-containing protein [Labilithrix sp.]|nr:LysR substrate-binding domain-containing protein [Labilithrix sp.]